MNRKEIHRMIRFLFVGASNTLVGYLSYLLFIWMLSSFEFRYDYIIAGILSFVVSIHWAFVLNKIFVFQTSEWRQTAKKELLKSYITYGFSGLVLNNILLYIFIDLCGISKYFAPILVLFFLVPFNYLVNKYWVYGIKLAPEADRTE